MRCAVEDVEVRCRLGQRARVPVLRLSNVQECHFYRLDGPGADPTALSGRKIKIKKTSESGDDA